MTSSFSEQFQDRQWVKFAQNQQWKRQMFEIFNNTIAMTINDDGWYFSEYVSGYAHLFTFKQEQSQYKKCNFNTCAVYAEVPKIKCL